MTTPAALWQQIRDFYDASPETEHLRGVRPGASPAAFDALAATLPVALPPLLRAFYAEVDGFAPAVFRSFPLNAQQEPTAVRLLPLAEIPAELARLQTEPPVYLEDDAAAGPQPWPATWLPVAEDEYGDLLALNLAETPDAPFAPGAVLQLVPAQRSVEYLAPDLLTWFRTTAVGTLHPFRLAVRNGAPVPLTGLVVNNVAYDELAPGEQRPFRDFQDYLFWGQVLHLYLPLAAGPLQVPLDPAWLAAGGDYVLHLTRPLDAWHAALLPAGTPAAR